MSYRFCVAAVLLAFVAGGCGPETGDTHVVHHDGGHTDLAGTVCKSPPKDSDGDGISDENEGVATQRDSDGDGTPDYMDLDSDNDGIPDQIEGHTIGNTCVAPIDTDQDGKPDYLDLDSDSATNSTVPDKIEAGMNPGMPLDTDQDGVPDYRDDDNDGDGILDVYELTPVGGAVAAMTLAAAPDTDNDGIPDFLDTDSDNDTISDRDEGAVDTDGDLTPNYRDLDSDGDCVPDAFEAGDDNLMTSPIDTDGDGAPDYADKDSDADGLKDDREDTNCNGIVDPCETSRLLPDTDGDGTNDLIESEACAVKPPDVQLSTNCKCDGTNAAISPVTRGDFVFIVDYQKPPVPDLETLALSSDLSQADVVFALDTTASMDDCLSNLANGLAGIVPTLQKRVPNIAFGVVGFKDYGDVVTTYTSRIQTVNTAPGLAVTTNALKSLSAAGGGDDPENGWAALWSIASSTHKTVKISSSSNYDIGFTLANTPPKPVTTGETQGTLYGAGFRQGSVPIIVTVGDVAWHDAPGTVASGENGIEAYPSTYCSPCTGAPSRQETIDALLAIGARVVGLGARRDAGYGNAIDDPKPRAIGNAQATAAVVKPADFGPVGTRPSTCSLAQCCTGTAGAGEAPIGGTCPLGFTVSGTTGAGVSDSVAAGIIALANGLNLSIYVQASDVDPGVVDNFIDKLVPNLSPNALTCITMVASPLQDNYTGPKALTAAPDGVLDTFPGITVGQKVCFDVHPKVNNAVMNTEEPQLLRAQLQVKGRANNNVFDLGQPRQVFFLVPPVIMNGPLP